MLRVNVAAHPGAPRERVDLQPDGALGVWVRARPVDGQANRAIELAIASALGLRPNQVQLVVGKNGRRKIVEVDLPGVEALYLRLAAHGERSDSSKYGHS